MFSSNLKFFLKSTINITDATSDTFIVSEDFELGEVIDTGGETVSIVLRNARQIERFECTITAGVATIVKRGLTQDPTSTEDSNLKKQWTDGTTGYITALAFDIIDKGGDTMTGPLKFSGTTNQGLVVNSLTTAQRLALTPTNGAIVYDSTLGENYQYIGGSWSAMSSGSTQPNASTTVAGKVEIATTAQSIAGTDTGETGAYLSVTPSDTAKNIQSGTFVYGVDAGGDDTYVVALNPILTTYTTGQELVFKPTTTNTGACSIDFGPGVKNIKTKDGNDPQTGVIRANSIVSVKYDGTNMVLTNEDFATTTNKGIVEMATDAEATAGTDQERYINSYQAKQNYSPKSLTYYSGAGSATIVNGGTIGTTATANSLSAVLMADSAVSGASWEFVIPPGVTSITSIKASYEAINAGVVSVLFYTTTYSRSAGTVPVLDGNGAQINHTSSGTDGRISQVTAGSDCWNALTITPGNILSVTVTRNGNDGSDTYTATWRIVGIEVVFA